MRAVLYCTPSFMEGVTTRHSFPSTYCCNGQEVAKDHSNSVIESSQLTCSRQNTTLVSTCQAVQYADEVKRTQVKGALLRALQALYCAALHCTTLLCAVGETLHCREGLFWRHRLKESLTPCSHARMRAPPCPHVTACNLSVCLPDRLPDCLYCVRHRAHDCECCSMTQVR